MILTKNAVSLLQLHSMTIRLIHVDQLENFYLYNGVKRQFRVIWGHRVCPDLFTYLVVVVFYLFTAHILTSVSNSIANVWYSSEFGSSRADTNSLSNEREDITADEGFTVNKNPIDVLKFGTSKQIHSNHLQTLLRGNYDFKLHNVHYFEHLMIEKDKTLVIYRCIQVVALSWIVLEKLCILFCFTC